MVLLWTVDLCQNLSFVYSSQTGTHNVESSSPTILLFPWTLCSSSSVSNRAWFNINTNEKHDFSEFDKNAVSPWTAIPVCHVTSLFSKKHRSSGSFHLAKWLLLCLCIDSCENQIPGCFPESSELQDQPPKELASLTVVWCVRKTLLNTWFPFRTRVEGSGVTLPKFAIENNCAGRLFKRFGFRRDGDRVSRLLRGLPGRGREAPETSALRPHGVSRVSEEAAQLSWWQIYCEMPRMQKGVSYPWWGRDLTHQQVHFGIYSPTPRGKEKSERRSGRKWRSKLDNCSVGGYTGTASSDASSDWHTENTKRGAGRRRSEIGGGEKEMGRWTTRGGKKKRRKEKKRGGKNKRGRKNKRRWKKTRGREETGQKKKRGGEKKKGRA